MDFKLSDIQIDNEGYIYINNIGRVGLWWRNYNKKVTVCYGFGKSFYSTSELHIKEKLLRLLNNGN